MKLKFQINNKQRTIEVQLCKSAWSKFRGLMFRKNPKPLLFVFKKQKKISIHSLFCKPFIAIWLDENKKATKVQKITGPKLNISGRGKYLLEFPISNTA